MLRDIIEQNEEVKVNSREVQLLREHFAGCFNNEGKFDLEKFRMLIGDDINIVEENQDFNFLGKSYARMIANQESLTVIRPDEPHNSKPENRDSENIYISGDNLDALKHLCKSYSGQVKCIYIDPPYNTGSDGFVYNDNFTFNAEELKAKLGINQEQAEHILDMKKSTSASDAAWLTFMLPRLELAKDMLSKDGVIFISIDDNEQANLKLLCDEIFGVENFLGNLSIKNNPRGRQSDTFFATVHEYLLCYARNYEDCTIEGLPLTPEQKGEYSYDDNDGKGKYRLLGLRQRGVASLREDRPDMYFPIYVNSVSLQVSLEKQEGWEEVTPHKSDGRDGRWMWGIDKCVDEKDRLVAKSISTRNEFDIFVKDYLIRNGRERKRKPNTIWEGTELNNQVGTTEVKSLLGGDYMSFPKSSQYIKLIVNLIAEDNDIVMDFFSGSGTTADAVLQLNAEHDGKRKFIMVQLQEPTPEKSAARKAGYKTIDEVGMERIRRAAKQIAEANPLFKGDLGFKHYTLESFEPDTIDRLYDFDMNANINDNDILSKFGAQTVLTTWLCRDGYGLNPKVEEVKLKDYTAYLCGKHLYLLGSDFYQDEMAELIDKMADPAQQFNPDVIVVFGYGMGYSSRLMLDKNLRALADARGNKISLDIRY